MTAQSYIPRATFVCAVCQRKFHRYPSRVRGRYAACSRRCSTTVGNWERARRAYDAVRDMSEPERAWLAALIDGEGCLSYVDTYPRIVIVNTDAALLDRARAFMGVGRLAARRRQEAHHKQSWALVVDGYPAIHVLEQVLDWLLTKQDKAVTALATRLDSIDRLEDILPAIPKEG